MVRDLIVERLKAKDISLTEASTRIGRNASYLQQFVKRGTPKELHEKERAMLAEILGVSEDQLREQSTTLVRAVHHAVLSDPHNQGKTPGRQNTLDTLKAASIELGMLPTYGTTLVTTGSSTGSADGLFALTERPVAFMKRPDFLEHNGDAYTIIVPDNRMAPWASSGDRLTLNPHEPYQSGSHCLFRENLDSGACLIGKLVEINGETWNVSQYEFPQRIIRLPRKEYPIAHTVVANVYRQ